MRTPRHRRTQAPRRLRQERVAPYSPETQEAFAAFIGELVAMPPDVLLLFQSILKGESLRKIAESRGQDETETRAATPEAVVDEAMRAATRTIDGIIKDALKEAGRKI